MRTSSLYLALLPLLCGLAAAFSVHQAGISGIKPTQIIENRNNNKNNPRSAIISAVVAASLFAAQPSGAFVENGHFQSNQISITLPSNTVAIASTQTINTETSSFSSLQLSNSLASPMGEFKPETDTGISPGFSTFGQWFFLLYVVVSLLAGAKEIGGRIMNMNKDE
mmetsp:Transcript_24890/g.36790  ORF Transcript_24890/g.36790 Transcript_24890/m.36790 type:complete len:167 (-) Transcript_24890:177-677(-)